MAATPTPVANAYQPGLQALAGNHRRLISCSDDRCLTGSVDLDDALGQEQPNEPRWDYGVGYRHQDDEYAVWVEVHSAQTSEVKQVLRKLRWLKDWLNADGQPLRRITADNGSIPAYVWIASGRNRLPRHTRQAKLAAQEGIKPRKSLELP